MRGDWLSLQQALEYVTQLLGNEASAFHVLGSELVRGSLQSRAYCFAASESASFGERRNLELTSDFWKHADVQLRTKGSMSSINIGIGTQHQIVKKLGLLSPSSLKQVNGQLRLSPEPGIELLQDNVLKIWPLHDKSDTVDPKPPTKVKRRTGRPPAQGSLQQKDAPIVSKMRELRATGKATSDTQAAWSFVEQAAGYGSPGSKVDRLVRRYKEAYPDAS